jgi:hypothetical protein
MSMRQHLALTEQRYGRDGRGEDDAVIDKIPKAENAFKVRSIRRLRSARACFHVLPLSALRNLIGRSAISQKK